MWQSLHYCSAVGDYSQSRKLSTSGLHLRPLVFWIGSFYEAQGWL